MISEPAPDAKSSVESLASDEKRPAPLSLRRMSSSVGVLVGIGVGVAMTIVLLMGLVTKNSILLVDSALLNQKEGKPLYSAILESGVARLRPILMTTIAMITGILPIEMGIGAGSEQRSPMAIAVIGGLITSTLLTLIVVPVIFTYIDSLQYLIFGRLLKGAGDRRAQDPLHESKI